ncbi:MAG: GFA family protein [Gammaproteobacteria bacterium]
MPEDGASVAERLHQGACHCGAVRFQVLGPREIRVEDCNCSICRKAGYLHWLVAARRFTLLTGADSLVTYAFNTGTARHTFCRHCGVKSFYVPRSNPDGYSVNLRCIAPGTFETVLIDTFDGRDWERHAAALTARTVD